MFIHDPPKSQTRKELKVNVPVRIHLRLQASHAVEGREAPKVVAEALNLYFQKLAAESATSR
jgi:hypothetical protein